MPPKRRRILWRQWYFNVNVGCFFLLFLDCGCNVGGSISPLCDKLSGQCTCRARITGRSCNEPLQLHYFPTLYQMQYEAEDGYTSTRSPVRFGYDERIFPEYSWRGYAVFSQIQVSCQIFACQSFFPIDSLTKRYM